MVLAGHSGLATTHKFSLAVADDLAQRAMVATAKVLHQELVYFGTPPSGDKRMVDNVLRKSLH
jgi:hypothetical protein